MSNHAIFLQSTLEKLSREDLYTFAGNTAENVVIWISKEFGETAGPLFAKAIEAAKRGDETEIAGQHRDIARLCRKLINPKVKKESALSCKIVKACTNPDPVTAALVAAQLAIEVATIVAGQKGRQSEETRQRKALGE